MISPDNLFQGRTSLPLLCWWRHTGTSRRTRRTTRSWGERWRQGSATSSPSRYLQQLYHLHLWCIHTIRIIVTLKVFSISNHLQANLTRKNLQSLPWRTWAWWWTRTPPPPRVWRPSRPPCLQKSSSSLRWVQHADMVVVKWWWQWWWWKPGLDFKLEIQTT